MDKIMCVKECLATAVPQNVLSKFSPLKLDRTLGEFQA